MNNELKNVVSSLLHTPIREVVKLHGDASYRTYYRAIADDGQSYIVMQMPEGKQSASEEITNFNGTHQELPFINVSKYLKECGLPVPEIVAQGHEHHILILEDLGDRLMGDLVSDKDATVQREWYGKAIDLLVRMQKQTEKHRDNNCVAFQRSFDSTLFDWEFDHFLEYCIEARLKKTLSAEDLATFKKYSRKISREIENLPYGFTHRDFQSRNLLFKNDSLFVIDFQDALMGPRVYDLVSLLRDSYVKLPSELVQELISYYAGSKKLDAKEIGQQFDMVTVQRKLKDAGRFVYIDHVKRNPKFLKFIPTSLGYVKEAFGRIEEYKGLYDTLARYLPEWK
jgi:aminoglycoside/choline kinase family phosphotransferase